MAVEISANAGFAVPAIYAYCEQEGITYTIALLTNPRFEEIARGLLDEATRLRWTGGSKQRLLSEGVYQAGSWERGRRVVYKVEAMEQ